MSTSSLTWAAKLWLSLAEGGTLAERRGNWVRRGSSLRIAVITLLARWGWKRTPPHCVGPGSECPPRVPCEESNFAAVILSQQTAEPDFFCYFLCKPHEGTFQMVAVWAFEGPLSVLRAMGLDTRRHHHRPALWARWPLSRDRSWGCEPETEHVIFLSRAGALTSSQVPPEITIKFFR
jgi:hypothetical protein